MATLLYVQAAQAMLVTFVAEVALQGWGPDVVAYLEAGVGIEPA